MGKNTLVHCCKFISTFRLIPASFAQCIRSVRANHGSAQLIPTLMRLISCSPVQTGALLISATILVIVISIQTDN